MKDVFQNCKIFIRENILGKNSYHQETRQIQQNINPFFYISFFIIFISIYFKFPSLSYSAEIWAETGTNFLDNALKNDFFDALTIPEFGYLPLFQRVISLFVVKVLGLVLSYPYVIQIITLTLISFYSSIFNLKIFRDIISSDVLRFILSLAIGLGPDYDDYSFINFPYFGFTLCLTVLFINLNKLSIRWTLIFLFFSAIIICSKGVFIIFVPLYFCAFILHLYFGNKRAIFFYGTLVFASMVQLMYMLMHLSPTGPGNGDKVPLPELINHVLYSIWNTFNSLFFFQKYPSEIGVPGFNILYFILLIVLISWVGIKFFKKGKKMPLLFFLTTIYLAGASIFLMLLLNKVWFWEDRFTINWDFYVKVPLMRWTYFAVIGTFLSLAEILYLVLPIKEIAVTLSAWFCLQSFIVPFMEFRDHFAENSNSNWEAYKNMLHLPAYYIPVNPGFPWAITKNTDVYPVEDIKNPNLPNNLYALLILNRPQILLNDISIIAFDDKGNQISQALRLGDYDNASVFFKFPDAIKLSRIKYLDPCGQEIELPSDKVKFIISL